MRRINSANVIGISSIEATNYTAKLIACGAVDNNYMRCSVFCCKIYTYTCIHALVIYIGLQNHTHVDVRMLEH